MPEILQLYKKLLTHPNSPVKKPEAEQVIDAAIKGGKDLESTLQSIDPALVDYEIKTELVDQPNIIRGAYIKGGESRTFDSFYLVATLVIILVLLLVVFWFITRNSDKLIPESKINQTNIHD
jgi:hypothetical protein